jgi:alpha-galactosidase
VLDDGWFKGRNDDTTSLGDWSIDRDKYPDGLTPLIDHVEASACASASGSSPRWSISTAIWHAPIRLDSRPAKDSPRAGSNMCLISPTPEVSDYLFDRIAAILSEHAIDYIKWDHNRILTRRR